MIDMFRKTGRVVATAKAVTNAFEESIAFRHGWSTDKHIPLKYRLELIEPNGHNLSEINRFIESNNLNVLFSGQHIYLNSDKSLRDIIRKYIVEEFVEEFVDDIGDGIILRFSENLTLIPEVLSLKREGDVKDAVDYKRLTLVNASYILAHIGETLSYLYSDIHKDKHQQLKDTHYQSHKVHLNVLSNMTGVTPRVPPDLADPPPHDDSRTGADSYARADSRALGARGDNVPGRRDPPRHSGRNAQYGGNATALKGLEYLQSTEERDNDKLLYEAQAKYDTIQMMFNGRNNLGRYEGDVGDSEDDREAVHGHRKFTDAEKAESINNITQGIFVFSVVFSEKFLEKNKFLKNFFDQLKKRMKRQVVKMTGGPGAQELTRSDGTDGTDGTDITSSGSTEGSESTETIVIKSKAAFDRFMEDNPDGIQGNIFIAFKLEQDVPPDLEKRLLKVNDLSEIDDLGVNSEEIVNHLSARGEVYTKYLSSSYGDIAPSAIGGLIPADYRSVLHEYMKTLEIDSLLSASQARFASKALEITEYIEIGLAMYLGIEGLLAFLTYKESGKLLSTLNRGYCFSIDGYNVHIHIKGSNDVTLGIVNVEFEVYYKKGKYWDYSHYFELTIQNYIEHHLKLQKAASGVHDELSAGVIEKEAVELLGRFKGELDELLGISEYKDTKGDKFMYKGERLNKHCVLYLDTFSVESLYGDEQLNSIYEYNKRAIVGQDLGKIHTRAEKGTYGLKTLYAYDRNNIYFKRNQGLWGRFSDIMKSIKNIEKLVIDYSLPKMVLVTLISFLILAYLVTTQAISLIAGLHGDGASLLVLYGMFVFHYFSWIAFTQSIVDLIDAIQLLKYGGEDLDVNDQWIDKLLKIDNPTPWNQDTTRPSQGTLTDRDALSVGGKPDTPLSDSTGSTHQVNKTNGGSKVKPNYKEDLVGGASKRGISTVNKSLSSFLKSKKEKTIESLEILSELGKLNYRDSADSLIPKDRKYRGGKFLLKVVGLFRLNEDRILHLMYYHFFQYFDCYLRGINIDSAEFLSDGRIKPNGRTVHEDFIKEDNKHVMGYLAELLSSRQKVSYMWNNGITVEMEGGGNTMRWLGEKASSAAAATKKYVAENTVGRWKKNMKSNMVKLCKALENRGIFLEPDVITAIRRQGNKINDLHTEMNNKVEELIISITIPPQSAPRSHPPFSIKRMSQALIYNINLFFKKLTSANSSRRMRLERMDRKMKTIKNIFSMINITSYEIDDVLKHLVELIYAIGDIVNTSENPVERELPDYDSDKKLKIFSMLFKIFVDNHAEDYLDPTDTLSKILDKLNKIDYPKPPKRASNASASDASAGGGKTIKKKFRKTIRKKKRRATRKLKTSRKTIYRKNNKRRLIGGMLPGNPIPSHQDQDQGRDSAEAVLLKSIQGDRITKDNINDNIPINKQVAILSAIYKAYDIILKKIEAFYRGKLKELLFALIYIHYLYVGHKKRAIDISEEDVSDDVSDEVNELYLDFLSHYRYKYKDKSAVRTGLSPATRFLHSLPSSFIQLKDSIASVYSEMELDNNLNTILIYLYVLTKILKDERIYAEELVKLVDTFNSKGYLDLDSLSSSDGINWAPSYVSDKDDEEDEDDQRHQGLMMEETDTTHPQQTTQKMTIDIKKQDSWQNKTNVKWKDIGRVMGKSAVGGGVLGACIVVAGLSPQFTIPIAIVLGFIILNDDAFKQKYQRVQLKDGKILIGAAGKKLYGPMHKACSYILSICGIPYNLLKVTLQSVIMMLWFLTYMLYKVITKLIKMVGGAGVYAIYLLCKAGSWIKDKTLGNGSWVKMSFIELLWNLTNSADDIGGSHPTFGFTRAQFLEYCNDEHKLIQLCRWIDDKIDSLGHRFDVPRALIVFLEILSAAAGAAGIGVIIGALTMSIPVAIISSVLVGLGIISVFFGWLKGRTRSSPSLDEACDYIIDIIKKLINQRGGNESNIKINKITQQKVYKIQGGSDTAAEAEAGADNKELTKMVNGINEESEGGETGKILVGLNILVEIVVVPFIMDSLNDHIPEGIKDAIKKVLDMLMLSKLCGDESGESTEYKGGSNVLTDLKSEYKPESKVDKIDDINKYFEILNGIMDTEEKGKICEILERYHFITKSTESTEPTDSTDSTEFTVFEETLGKLTNYLDETNITNIKTCKDLPQGSRGGGGGNLELMGLFNQEAFESLVRKPIKMITSDSGNQLGGSAGGYLDVKKKNKKITNKKRSTKKTNKKRTNKKRLIKRTNKKNTTKRTNKMSRRTNKK